MQKTYDFDTPLDPKSVSEGEPLFNELVQSKAFLRLRGISFLGAIDYLLASSINLGKPKPFYSRYQHSLGVARLSLLYAQGKGLSSQGRQLIYSAALLHDIGHSPLSHSLESIFEEKFEINHHKIAADLILGRGDLGKEINSKLKMHGVDPDYLLSILFGKEDPFDGFFCGPINFDTIEGISRSMHYVSSVLNVEDPLEVTKAAMSRHTDGDRRIVDRFWKNKGKVYKILIRSMQGAAIDFLCQDIVRHHNYKLKREDCLLTEKQFFEKIPSLKNALLNIHEIDISKYFSVPLYYKEREFYISDRASFFKKEDQERYRQLNNAALLPVEILRSSLDLRGISEAWTNRKNFYEQGVSEVEEVL